MCLDYRYPAMNKYCVVEVQAATSYLETGYAISHFVLVSWLFAGGPVFTLGGSDKGCATVASQPAATDGISIMAPKSGVADAWHWDRTLRFSCSQQLFQQYGSRRERELKLFEGDDYALTWNSREAGESCAILL